MMATPQSGEKTMSSRLLTMKFMQRAASSQTSPSTPSDGPHSKRIRLSNGTASPVTPLGHREAVQAALEAEEQKRLQALDKHAADHGETRWVLDVQDMPKPANSLNVMTASFGDIDALQDDDDIAPMYDTTDHAQEGYTIRSGRRVFGRLQHAVADSKPVPGEAASSPSISTSSDDEDYDPTRSFMREARKQHQIDRYADQRAYQAEQKQAALDTRPKEVNLKRITSISGGGSTRPTPKGGKSNMECFKCHQRGHIARDCPNSKR